jgi:hypothetical protein
MFPLKIFDSIHAQNLYDVFANLRVDIGTKQSNRCAKTSKKIFKSTSNVALTLQRVDSCKYNLTATIMFNHLCTTMALDAIIKSGVSEKHLLVATT